MKKQKLSRLMAIALISALSALPSFAATTYQDSHVNSGLENNIYNSSYMMDVWGWHSSSSSSRAHWAFNAFNESANGGVTKYKMPNNDLIPLTNGSRAYPHEMKTYFTMPNEVIHMINIYGVENIGLRLNLGHAGTVLNSQVHYTYDSGRLWFSFTPVLRAINTDYWKNTTAWNSFNSYGKIPIAETDWYGRNYTSAAYGGRSGSIMMRRDGTYKAYKHSSGGMRFNSGMDVNFDGTMVPIQNVSVGSAVWGGGAHGNYFDYPINFSVYDTNINAENLTMSGAKHISGGTHWVKAGENFSVTARGVATGSHHIIKPNSNHLYVKYNGGGAYLDSKTFSDRNDVPYPSNWANSSPAVSLNSGSGTRSGNGLASQFTMSMTGDKDIEVQGLSRLVHYPGNNLSNEKLFKQITSPNSIIIKSDSQGPAINIPTDSSWSKGSKTISVSASDSRSGVKSTTVRTRVNGGGWSGASSNLTVTLSGTGTHEVEVVSTDNVGNESRTTRTYKIDGNAPTFSALPSSEWSSTDKSFTITATDNSNGSGVSALSLYRNGSHIKNGTRNSNGTYSLSHTESANGSYSYEVRTSDAAGNANSATFTINMDKIAPVINGVPNQNWSKTNIPISITATDNPNGPSGSGLGSFTVTRNGGNLSTNISGNNGNFSYNETTEGINNYTVNAQDRSNPRNVSQVTYTVKIDKTAPSFNVSTSGTVTDRNITLSLSALSDAHSGTKEILVSESANFSSNVTKITTGNANSLSIKHTLNKGNNPTANYNQRTVYVRAIDNVGNYSDKSVHVLLNPIVPGKPVITKPSPDDVILKNEPIVFEWKYFDPSNEFYLPQQKAEMIITNTQTGEIRTIDYNQGPTSTDVPNKTENHTIQLSPLPEGNYKAKVRVYNWNGISKESDEVLFRVHRFKNSGTVRTKTIVAPGPVTYLDFVTRTEIPRNATIEGYVYYKTDSNGNVLMQDPIKFEIKGEQRLWRPIKLPAPTTKLIVKYDLKNRSSPYIENITPILDDIKIYGR